MYNNSNMQVKRYFFLLIIVLLSNSNIIAQKGNRLNIALEHYVGSQPVALDSVFYKNDLGQTFNVTKFKYYLSNFKLLSNDSRIKNQDGYYLVNEDEDTTKRIVLNNIGEGMTTGISFTIGVDSLHNSSGAQEGALDPMYGMFWAWNSGYIFLKLEGKSPSSNSPGKIFEFHIGGYKTPTNCIRTIKLNFAQPVVINGKNELHLKVDIAEILKNPVTIDLTKLSSVTDFHNATMVADNYQDMFSVISVR